MANIVLFHPSIGLTEDVLAQAEALRKDGHNVLAPDLLEGQVFQDAGFAQENLEKIGIRELMMRAASSVKDFPLETFYMGFSVGAAIALRFAARKPGALGCIAIAGAVTLVELGVEAWPATVPLQLHFAEGDPGKRPEAITALAKSVREAGARFEVFSYSRGGHLFSFSSLSDYDPASAREMKARIGEFLSLV